MAGTIWIQFFALVAAISTGIHAGEGNFNLYVELSKDTAYVGEDLVVTCDILSKEGSDDIIIRWTRKIKDEDKPIQIGVNKFIEDHFNTAGRFSVNYTANHPVKPTEVKFQLTIKNVQPSDSGNIGCELEKHKIFVYKPFTVYSPLKSVQLTSQDMSGANAHAYANDDEVVYNEGEMRRFFCNAHGSYPAPKVEVFVGDKNITGQFNMSLVLKKTPKDQPLGLQDLLYEKVLRHDSFKIDYSMSGKRLECKAEVENTKFDPVSLGIKIKLAGYKPKFLCDHTVFVAMHTSNVNITCEVRAEPPVEDIRFYWSSVDQKNTSIEAGGTNGPYHGELIIGDNSTSNVEGYATDVLSGDTGNETIMVLHIERVFVQHFRLYYFEASNELGKSVHEIELKEDGASALTGQGNPVLMRASLGSVLVALLLVHSL